MATSSWLCGGGEMGDLTRRFDWSRTAVGPPESWPQSLRTIVSALLNTRFPMFLWWGPENVQFYNDAYRPILGVDRHPSALGQRGEECWAEIWPVVSPLLEHVRTAREATWAEDQLIPITRDGALQDCFWTFSYGPILDEGGGVAGVLVVTSETTERVQREREMRTLRDLAARAAQADDEATAWHTCIDVLATDPADVPFAFAYVLDDEQTTARLVSSSTPSPLAPDAISLDGNIDAVWPLRHVAETGHGELVRDVRQRFGDVAGPSCPEPVRSAFVLPITRAGGARPYGFLVAGASPRRLIDDKYRAFFGLVADHIASAIANVRAHEDARKRAAALAEIDRAKTDFFSNVSHEFRTPLTLMLGPLEDSLEDVEEPLSPRQRERLDLVHNSALRLLKLVNTLLDFSRIEAGRMQASYEATDIPALTRALVSTFGSVADSVGVALIVDAAPLPEPVWVDREMWEKIVLNLVSNAFKHTFEGSITVRVRGLGDHAELSVTDTGTGIAEGDLPRLFERFFRVKGARARTIEGSGIGLALVHDLVRLHGGTIRVESQLGRGSTFTVSVPTGNGHLPQDQLTTSNRSMTAMHAAFAHEARGWIDRSATSAPLATGTIERRRTTEARAHILLADDNTEVRNYVRRLLEEHYSVETVADGDAAIVAARARVPDLVLSDVMMPMLDGFGLIAALQADPRTAAVPVILLSARAGEEATLEGLQAGASDYLVKPFSARELAARIEGTLRTAKARSEAQRERSRLDAVLAALHECVVFQDASGIGRYCNAACERLLGLDADQIVGETPRDPRWQARWEDGSPAPDEDQALSVALRTERPVGQVLGVRRPDGTDVWLHVNAQPMFNADGTLAGAASSFFDTTEEIRRVHEAHERAELEKQLLGIVSHDLRTPLSAVLLGAELLLQDPALDERAHKIVSRVQSSAERSLRLVRDLLDFTQARLGGGIPITRQTLDLHACMQQVVDELRTANPGCEIVLRTEGDANGNWDGDRLAQVAHNLVTNALKYGNRGVPVRVTIRGGSKAEVVLEVHNEGDPIPAALLPELFKPLSRGPDEAERKNGSIGLGLFIVDQLVRAHEGSIAVRSTERDGTTFTVRLPRAGRAAVVTDPRSQEARVVRVRPA